MKRQLSKIVSAGNLSEAELSWDDAKQAAKLALSEADSQGCPPGLVWACVGMLFLLALFGQGSHNTLLVAECCATILLQSNQKPP